MSKGLSKQQELFLELLSGVAAYPISELAGVYRLEMTEGKDGRPTPEQHKQDLKVAKRACRSLEKRGLVKMWLSDEPIQAYSNLTPFAELGKYQARWQYLVALVNQPEGTEVKPFVNHWGERSRFSLP